MAEARTAAATAPAAAPAVESPRAPKPQKTKPLGALDAGDKAVKIEIEDVQLQAAVRLGGVTTEHLNEQKNGQQGLKMLWVRGEGLLVSFNSQEFIIPETNVKIAKLMIRSNGRTVAD